MKIEDNVLEHEQAIEAIGKFNEAFNVYDNALVAFEAAYQNVLSTKDAMDEAWQEAKFAAMGIITAEEKRRRDERRVKYYRA